MTKKQQNNHQGTGSHTEIKIMISGLRAISVSYCGLLLKNYLCHGASGITRHKKRSSSVVDALLPIIAISTLIGSNARSLGYVCGTAEGKVRMRAAPELAYLPGLAPMIQG